MVPDQSFEYHGNISEETGTLEMTRGVLDELYNRPTFRCSCVGEDGAVIGGAEVLLSY